MLARSFTMKTRKKVGLKRCFKPHMPALFMTSLPQGNQPKPPKGEVRYPNEITTFSWSWNPDRSRSLGATGKADYADDDDEGGGGGGGGRQNTPATVIVNIVHKRTNHE